MKRAKVVGCVLASALLLSGCSTVARVGAVLEATGEVVGKVGAVLSEGATADIRSGTDSVGITDAAAPAPAPAGSNP